MSDPYAYRPVQNGDATNANNTNNNSHNATTSNNRYAVVADKNANKYKHGDKSRYKHGGHNAHYGSRDGSTTDRDSGRNKGTASDKYRYNRDFDKQQDSVRRRYYDTADLDDVLQSKIATQLRENGIAETKVVPLSAKISQAVRDDVVDGEQSTQPQVTANLSRAINEYMDPILHNREECTDVSGVQKPRDAPQLSNMVLLRVAQIREEVEMCRAGVEDPPKTGRRGKGQTPRDRDPEDEKSQLMVIKEGIEKQKTEKEILEDKLREAHRDSEYVETDKERKERELKDLDAENYQLRQDLQDSEQDKQSLITRVRELQRDFDQIDKDLVQAKADNNKLRRQLDNLEATNRSLSSDFTKLQSEKAKLEVMVSQKDKEIVHLKNPNKDMVYHVNILEHECAMLRTQTRRLNEEKGLLKSRNQKMEHSLDDAHKQRNKLMVDMDNLYKENQELKQRNRRMPLVRKPRTLPDIMEGQGPSRTNSRALVRRSADSPTGSAERDNDGNRSPR